MTQEEKAKAYDKALEKAEKALEVCGTDKCETARRTPTFRKDGLHVVFKDCLACLKWGFKVYFSGTFITINYITDNEEIIYKWIC